MRNRLEPRLILSNSYLYKGMADEALIYANEALNIAPQSPLAMLAVGRAHFSAGDVASVNTLKKLAVRLPSQRITLLPCRGQVAL